MITEQFTVTCKRMSIYQNEAELTQSQHRQVIGQVESHAQIGSITVSGPAADELQLGDRLNVTLDRIA